VSAYSPRLTNGGSRSPRPFISTLGVAAYPSYRLAVPGKFPATGLVPPSILDQRLGHDQAQRLTDGGSPRNRSDPHRPRSAPEQREGDPARLPRTAQPAPADRPTTARHNPYANCRP